MRKKENDYIDGLSDQGLEVYNWIESGKMTKKELAEELDITIMALNYKLKGKNGGFSKVESFYIQRLMEEV